MHDLFEAVRQGILALDPQVREEFRKHYVAYKTQTNFVDLASSATGTGRAQAA